mmetsp:Transcript_10398/g.38353  ORF Transcript_10398/g.38353 Transcript_10398/m.38353 type:complete len:200 (+) Transcript_10398:645-1244(+)
MGPAAGAQVEDHRPAAAPLPHQARHHDGQAQGQPRAPAGQCVGRLEAEPRLAAGASGAAGARPPGPDHPEHPLAGGGARGRGAGAASRGAGVRPGGGAAARAGAGRGRRDAGGGADGEHPFRGDCNRGPRARRPRRRRRGGVQQQQHQQRQHEQQQRRRGDLAGGAALPAAHSGPGDRHARPRLALRTLLTTCTNQLTN